MFHSSFRLQTIYFIIVIIFFYTLSSAIAQSLEWPIGTLATASITHPPLSGAAKDQFKPNNAIDNDATTNWNDNTEEGVSPRPYPDIFTLCIGSVVNLDGIMLLSGSDGWILNYTVETSLDGSSWNLAATVELSNVVLRFIKFDNSPLNVKQLRIIITAAMNKYSRISEISPVYAAASASNSYSTTNLLGSSTSTPSSTSKSTSIATKMTTVTTTTPPLVTSGTKSNTVGIIAGGLGGLVGILLGVLAYFVWLLRKQRNGINGIGIEGVGQAVAVGGPQKGPDSGFSFPTNVVGELGGQYPQAFGGYSVIELA